MREKKVLLVISTELLETFFFIIFNGKCRLLSCFQKLKTSGFRDNLYELNPRATLFFFLFVCGREKNI